MRSQTFASDLRSNLHLRETGTRYPSNEMEAGEMPDADGEDGTARAGVPFLGAPRNPVAVTPPMKPGVVRRTSTIDTTSPDGWDEPQLVDARARDVTVDAAGRQVPLGEVRVMLRLDCESGLVHHLESSHDVAGLAGLTGTSVFNGFRRRLASELSEEVEGCTLLHALLDDLPSAVHVAQYAKWHAFGTVEQNLTLEVVESKRDIFVGPRGGESSVHQVLGSLDRDQVGDASSRSW